MKKKLFKAYTFGISTVCMATLLSGCHSAQNIAITPLTAAVGFIDSTVGRTNDEMTLLHKTCGANYVADSINLKILASFTDVINQSASDGETPLHAALKTGKPHDFIEILLTSGADPNKLDRYGNNALTFALMGNCETETIQLLIDSGVDVNVGSPFKTAIINDSSDAIINLLVKSGVDATRDMWNILEVRHWKNLCERLPTEFINPDARYPIMYNVYLSKSSNFSELKDMTEELSLIDIAIIRADSAQYEYFKSKGFEPSQKIHDHYAILQFPIDKGNLELTESLIHSGHKANLIDGSGISPLHLAAKSGNEKICKLLIKSGADVNLKDNNGDTPLHLSIKAKSIKSAILLLERGARSDQLNSEGESPIELAVNYDFDSLMPYLLNKTNIHKQ